MKQRRVVVARDAEDAAQALQAKDAARVFTDVASDDPRSVAFMFAGGGAQHPNMGLDLHRDEPVFRATLEQALAFCETKLNRPLRAVLFPAAGHEAQAAKQLEQPSLALPALLAVQVAQARLLMSWGIQPAAMIGHSMGEYTAAHLAGVFSLEDALTLVELRGRLFESLPEGAMLSVPLGEEALRAWMTPELSISVVNAPNMTVVGGPVAAIEALHAQLAAQEIEAARVRINVAAHSSMLEPILQPFAAVFQRLALKAPTVPFVSNLSGTWITPAEATDPAYWVKHLRNTVRFADGVQTLLQDESRVLLEVGPGRTLSSLARQHPARKAQQPVINSMRHPDEVVNDQAHALTVLGRLWAVGVDVPWAQLQGQERRLRVPLPTYAFDHARHWVEPGRGVHALPASERSLHKRKDLTEWFYQPSWQAKSVAVTATSSGEPNATKERTLVFADHHGVADAAVATLRACGADVVVVRQGKAFKRIDALSFTVVPGLVADMDRLVEALIADDRVPSRILHAWCVTRSDPVPAGAAGVTAMRRLGFDSLLSLAQAMGREDWSDPLQLLVLCDGLQRVAGEGAHTPAKALLLGPTSVIPREFSNVRCALMDIDAPALGSRPANRMNDGILAELGGDLLDPVVAWRGGQRWVQGYTAEPLAQPTVSKLRQRGVYLITGGLGGVGLALASHLANTVQARLVLLGRTALPPRDQWERIAADHHTATSMAQRLQQLMALERAGADVMVVAADVTHIAQMQTVLKQVRERFGDINGVLHTAGVLNDGVMQLKEAQAASAVFAPKVDGTLALEAALHSVQTSSLHHVQGSSTGNASTHGRGSSPLDFIVLFSSISAFAGLAGQVDYAAANAYLDAYAQDRFQRDGTPVIAINWSQWQEVGMAAALAQSLGIEPASLPSQATASDASIGQTIGHPFVDRCLRSTPNEQLFETRFSRDTHWLLEEHRVQGGEALIPGTGYLEIVRTAFAHAQALSAGQAVSLRKVNFLAPFAVMPGQARDLRVHFQPHPSGPNVFGFTVTGRPADVDAAAPWAEHVRGLASVVTPTVLQASPPDAIVQRCTERLQQGSAAPVHLHFGPRWRNVTQVHHGRGEALMQLDLPQVFAADLATFPLHPAMMDLATAGAQSLLPGFDESRDFFVPASYEQITVHGALTSPCFSHIRARLDDATLADNGDDLATFDVTITDNTGRILVDVNGFTMIRVRDKALLAVGAAHAPATSATPSPANDAHAATPALKPRATANTILASGMRDGMLSSEGAAVLERVLAWGAGPQIIVSPQDLHGLLAQWHAPPARSLSAQDNGQPDGQAEGEAHPGARAPVTPTEQLIAQMWGEMLGHHRVAATDNFFDLGGHSLLAVQVINKLKKRTGKALPLTALLEAPTVEELAALIEPPGTLEAALAGGGAQASAQAATASTSTSKAAPLGVKRDGVVNRTLIPIRKGEGRPPLFLVHDGNGETLLYRTLAHKLDPRHPVYGLQPAQRADASFVDTSITAMATAHIEQLRSVQPQGPYYIAGLCAGGVVAHEMALQLQQTGEKTAYLGLMDAADVAAPSRGYENAQRWQRFLSTLDGDASTPLPLRVAKVLPAMAKKVVGALRYQVAYRLEHRRLAKGIGEWQGAAPAAPSVAPISFLAMYELAHLKHQPQGVMQSGEAVLYRAKQGTGDDADVPFIERYADDSLGWQPRFSAGVKVTEVPGGHASLLQEPNVQTLAVAVQRDIDQALTANAKRPAVGDGPDEGTARTMPQTSRSAAPLTLPHGASQRATEPLESP
jgi:malonyl CoA-acyl carrier protein transacylase/thioesterase domain-containing protein/NAD(P)-dependent dehydrogenase (short-subunit alcohol dehydrogenase family)/acyl carrier protein